MADKAKSVIDSHFSKKEQLNAELKNLGVSANHLSTIFKNQYGITPAEYRSELVTDIACHMLRNTKESLVRISLSCGFSSVSAFYSFCKKYIGKTPGAYRKTSGD